MTTIKLKRSATSGSVPSASDLEQGEVAINTADGRLFMKHTDDSIVEIEGAKGQKGQTGSTGDQGAKGQKGEIGDQGSSGNDGAKGDKGDKGAVGTDGSDGSKGQKGEQGVSGSDGSSGSDGDKGQKGEQGAAGNDGSNGSDGAKGEKGQKGQVGADGTDGSDGAKGEKGEKGQTGSAGSDGSDGAKGQKGEKGQTGSAGSDGSDGSKGEKGQKGQTGQKGQQGNFGGQTFSYQFNTATTDSDPTSGKLLFNNATPSSANRINIDDADDGGTDIQSYLRTIDDSTSTIKGHVRISNSTDADDFVIYTISSVAENSGYFRLVVSYIDGDATFSNNESLTVTFARTGDTGDKGQKGEGGTSGNDGAKGEKGQKGQTGATGSDGADGDKGQKGQTGAAGANGSDGSDGAKGQKGEKGQTGSAGTDGNDGAKGQKGEKGQTGASGSNGSDGAKGQKGEKGQTGSAGSNGSDGAKGEKGEKGAAGTNGSNGAKGQKGEKGQKGQAGSNGSNGSDGAKGEKGEKGQKGQTGAAGSNGSDGSDGAKGEKGQKGQTGAAGSNGSDGSDGDKGEKGQKGATGAGGSTGAKGQKGQKGQTGSTGSGGAKGQKGEKGQKGQTGAGGSTGSKGQKGQKGEVGPVSYTLPNTGNTSKWIKLGNFAASQDGRSILINVVSNSGYNASNAQNSQLEIRFKTSNGSSNQSGFYGDVQAYKTGPNGSPSAVRVVQQSSTSYDIWCSFTNYTGGGSFYSALQSAGTWTHSGTTSASAPTGTYIDATISKMWHSGNDGAGSGLDADTLDGNQASAFATSAQGTKADNALPKAGGTMTGGLIVDHNSSPMLKVQATNGSPWALELGRDDATNSKVYNGGGYWSFEHEPRYYNGGSPQKLFHDNYHPNADKWTTARTLSLSGDASGSVSWDGSANATLSVTVNDNSHNHDQLYGGSGWQTVNLNTIADNISSGYFSYEQFSSASSNKPPTSDNANGVITVGQHSGGYTAQLAFSSNGNIYWRDNPSTSYGTWRKMWDDGNDGAGSGLDADLLDGVQGSSYLRSDQNDTISGQLTVTTTNDAQILLQSTNTWTGIGFNDSGSNNEYIWHYGGTGTFAIGGGGSTVSGKKLHIDGGTTIGVNYDATSTHTNGLKVEGHIETAGEYYAPNKIIHTGDTDTYMQFHAANQWRVVTGNVERLEVNNSFTTSSRPIRVSGPPFYENAQVVSSNYTISNTYNAMSAGPITINNGVTVTIGDGEAWSIV